MATSTNKARKPKVRPADVCRLSLTIRGDSYAVRAYLTDDGRRSVRLRKSGSTDPYTVAETPHGPTCDCGDHTFRHDGRDAVGCKHCRALVAVGLIASAKGTNTVCTPVSKGVRSNDTLPVPKPSRPGIDRPADEFDGPFPPSADDPDDMESDPADWPAWTDQHVYVPARANLVIGGAH